MKQCTEMHEGTSDTMTVITDITTIDGKTHTPCLDEEKNLLIPFTHEHGVLYYMIPRELIVEMVRQDFPIQRTIFAERGEGGKLHLSAPLFSPEELNRLFKEQKTEQKKNCNNCKYGYLSSVCKKSNTGICGNDFSQWEPYKGSEE